MNTNRVSEIFIGDGTTLDTDGTSISALAAQLNIVGGNMTAAKGGSRTITTDENLFIINKLANGDLKRSFQIKGLNITAFKAESYVPATKEVWAIGYDRKATSGSIVVNNATQYDFSIRFKWDKRMYSERQELLRGQFTSSSSATQSNIADQIVNTINNSAFGSSAAGIKVIKAIKVGDGSGAYGLTAATNFGVEITALDVNQFANTTYDFHQVRFSVHTLDASGFDTTNCEQIQAADPGNGTYEQIYNLENYFYQYEGVLNRTKFPIPTLAYLSSAAGVTSGAFTLTSANTSGYDTVTFSNSAMATQCPAGSKVNIDGVDYEIKYYIDSTHGVLTSAATTTNATGVVKGKAWYDVINILVSDVVTTAGANVGQFSKKAIMIATPAIAAGATGNSAMTTAPTGTSDLVTLLNAYMTTTPGAFANISI